VVSVGHAIRREMAAVGDGLERVVARAGEIEVLVHNEVSSLERAYGENELRIRSLIEELVNQREAIVNNSERVRAAITGAHEGLSGDLMTSRERIVEAAEEASKRLNRLARRQGRRDHLLALHHGGRRRPCLDTRSTAVIDRLAETGRSVSENLTNAGQVAAEDPVGQGVRDHRHAQSHRDQIVSTLTDRTELLTETVRSMGDGLAATLSERTDTLVTTLAHHTDEVNRTLVETGDSIVGNLTHRTDALTATLHTLGETLTERTDTVNQTLKSTGDSIIGKPDRTHRDPGPPRSVPSAPISPSAPKPSPAP